MSSRGESRADGKMKRGREKGQMTMEEGKRRRTIQIHNEHTVLSVGEWGPTPARQ
jgi:hypothetical protein